jgi:hypothetical protein
VSPRGQIWVANIENLKAGGDVGSSKHRWHALVILPPGPYKHWANGPGHALISRQRTVPWVHGGVLVPYT